MSLSQSIYRHSEIQKTLIPLPLHTTHPIQTSILIQCTRKANHPSSIIHSQSSIPAESHAPHYQTLPYIPLHLHSYLNQCYVWREKINTMTRITLPQTIPKKMQIYTTAVARAVEGQYISGPGVFQVYNSR